MADNTPNPPGGAMPPKPAEAAKVQPKKETVRITLPPKPTAAPTVKLPSLAPASAPALAHGAATAPAAPATTVGTPRLSSASAPGLAKGAGTLRAPSTPAPRPAPAASGRTSGFDTFLAVTAGIVALACAGIAFYLSMLADVTY